MAIQKLNSFYNAMTDVLGGWGAGNDSSSCGPPQRELI